MKKLVLLAAALASGSWLAAQDYKGLITQGDRPVVAIPDLRGSGDAQKFMSAFNETLWADVDAAGLFKMVPKSMNYTTAPQQPGDFRPAAQPAQPVRGSRQPVKVANGGGLWMSDWSTPPVSANYLAFGYTSVQNGVLVLRGWFYDLGRGEGGNPLVIGKNYLASVDDNGARAVAHQFAADIIGQFGGKTLFGTHIYFVSDRTGHKEVWVMDPDGKNQRQLTHFNSITTFPSASANGAKVAFSSWVKGNPAIFVFSVDPVRDLRFYNQAASVNSSPSFTPDGKHVLYSSSAGGCCRIFMANLDGSGFRPLTASTAVETEPKVNPKTGAEVAFSSGRSGPEQIYRMSIDGTDIERLTPGEGEAANPSWHPEGQILAFAWTRGYAAGAWNIFVMDVATRKYTQLTHGEGRNEHPSWAPDGLHIAFDSTRGGRRQTQIYTMLADGSHVQQLTTQGNNEAPFWGL
jgi:TolB protein